MNSHEANHAEWVVKQQAAELASLLAQLAESEREKARLRDAFTGEAEVLAAKLAEWEAAGRKDREDIRVLTDCLLGWNNQFEAYTSNDRDRHPVMYEPVNLSDAMDVIHRRADEARAASRLVAEAGGTHG